MIRYVLHLVSDGLGDGSPSGPLGTYPTEREAREAGRRYLARHPQAWLQTQDEECRSDGRDVTP